MARIRKIEPMVEEVLETMPETRGDDYLLILAVWDRFVRTDISLRGIFENHEQLGIPPFETITRCRRKLQASNPSLRNEAVAEIRRQEEQDYISYSKE